ncbi:hypothetical protein ABZ891_23100 [Streptomyces sp. NPDC047023]|uniref:hypothetical protein n=1 Tax=Streptomyces sp. NPDC047023 TaxID=3155139 RepID=UPI0033EFB31B
MPAASTSTRTSGSVIDRFVELTGDSTPDGINQALSVYAYIEQVLSEGGPVIVQDTPDSPPQKLVIF